MGAPEPSSPPCQVIGGDKLPAASGGAAALCAAIARAASGAGIESPFAAEIRVLSPAMLSATLTVNGRTLPEHKFAAMDHDLDGSSFERFARAIVDQVKAATQAGVRER